jgi:hypothetical protein
MKNLLNSKDLTPKACGPLSREERETVEHFSHVELEVIEALKAWAESSINRRTGAVDATMLDRLDYLLNRSRQIVAEQESA